MGRRFEALVTGGAGFLGGHLVDALLATGKYNVTIFDLGPSASSRCSSIVGDLTAAADIAAACRGKDVVFHVATASPTAAGAARGEALMKAVNVDGTRNVIEACRAAGVAKLVYTSTASVVFAGRPLIDVDESCPYAFPPIDFYTGTKAEAEKMVLAANGAALATCALRPSGVFGPGNDRLLVPSVAARARKGKMRFMIGDGSNLFDWTYVGNVADAHVGAAERLAPGAPAAGQAFFVTNDAPEPFWGMLGDICEGLGYARPTVHLPAWLMMALAVLAGLAARLFGLQTDLNPMRVRLATVQRTVSCGRAKAVLGYVPGVSMEEGKRRMLEHFQYLHKDADARDKAA